MGRIFYLMGKSASGKDTLYKRLLKECPGLRTVVLYTTRPMREGETDGVEYHFTTPEKLQEFQETGRMIELRTYQTVYGPVSYTHLVRSLSGVGVGYLRGAVLSTRGPGWTDLWCTGWVSNPWPGSQVGKG